MKRMTTLGTILVAASSLVLSYSCTGEKTTYTAKDGLITHIKGSRQISGVYPHLTTYSHDRENGKYKFGNECGIGGVAVWNGKLYMINYAAHEPKGSEHNLYIVDQDKNMYIFPESVGGTPAARMIHQESTQLLIGHYLIDQSGKIRTIPITQMPGRITAIARHLTDPENKVYYYDMEGKLYEANVHTLESKLLYKNPLPGWHGKGGYTSQGKLVLANNGEHNGFENPKDWQVPVDEQAGPENYGALAEFDGKKFTMVERRQFTDVTTQHGIDAVPNDQSPLWAMGWDKRSVRLKVMENGQWNTFLLPKATYNNDPSHGWFTEWPRIREIGNGEMMMDMHGMFYDFPATFSKGNTAGIRPIASHIRYVPDFCSWDNQIVIATDESSIQGNLLTGQPQSNLWFGTKEDFDEWGPASGYGSIWLNDNVTEGQVSLPYLFAGFDNRTIHLINHGKQTMKLMLELDKAGDGNWELYETIEIAAGGYVCHMVPQSVEAEWLRATALSSGNATIALHYTSSHLANGEESAAMFEALADIDTKGKVLNAKLYSNRANYNMSCFTTVYEGGKQVSATDYEFRKFSFDFASGIVDTLATRALQTKVYYSENHQFEAKDVPEHMRHQMWSVDEASVILKTSKGNLRLPKGPAAMDQTIGARAVRELESEREIANIHGTFYELPLLHVGKEPLFEMMRPVSSHNKLIDDFNTWNGLLVLSGLKSASAPSEHVYRSPKNDAALWFGGIDDLWKLGKPVGMGGPWKNTAVKTATKSDKYIMTGYDKKTLQLTADKDITVTLWLNVAHYQDEMVAYKTFELKANQTIEYVFPAGFSAHWAALEASADCVATAKFIYE